jgi:arylformamidase
LVVNYLDLLQMAPSPPLPTTGPAPASASPGSVGATYDGRMDTLRLWDISPPVHAGSPVFPGDAAYRQAWAATITPGCPVNVSTLTLSPHTGAHADAPLHYDPSGAAAGALSLRPYLGRCRVIHAIGCGPLVHWEHIAHALADLPPRVLVRTCAKAPVDRWDPALTAYAADTVERLADLGVQLIGIDTASIDPADSKTLDSHQVIRRRDACGCWRTWCSTTCPRATTNSSPCP